MKKLENKFDDETVILNGKEYRLIIKENILLVYSREEAKKYPFHVVYN